jgi:hypothetical protein
MRFGQTNLVRETFSGARLNFGATAGTLFQRDTLKIARRFNAEM